MPPSFSRHKSCLLGLALIFSRGTTFRLVDTYKHDDMLDAFADVPPLPPLDKALAPPLDEALVLPPNEALVLPLDEAPNPTP